MRERLTTLGEVAGLASISAGFALISPALGLIAAGVGLFAASFVAGGGDS